MVKNNITWIWKTVPRNLATWYFDYLWDCARLLLISLDHQLNPSEPKSNELYYLYYVYYYPNIIQEYLARNNLICFWCRDSYRYGQNWHKRQRYSRFPGVFKYYVSSFSASALSLQALTASPNPPNLLT